MPTILIIEDDAEWQRTFRSTLERLVPPDQHLNILQATDVGEAERVIQIEILDLILLDGCLNKEQVPDGLDLIEPIRAKYPDPFPIIAMSQSPSLRAMMRARGCNYAREKQFAARQVFGLLGITPNT